MVLLAVEPEENTIAVPREWVDIPAWAADYFVAVEIVHSETESESGLQVLGYATHRQLKHRGSYRESDRSYLLPRAGLIAELTLMFAASQLLGSRKTAVAPLSPLSSRQEETYLHKLSCCREPLRAAVPFQIWGALVVRDRWRQRLYEQRLHRSKETVSLRAWLENLRAGLSPAGKCGWQALEVAREILKASDGQWRYAFRGSSDVSLAVPTTISGLAALLQTCRDKETCLTAVRLLGQIGKGSAEAIASLTRVHQMAGDGDLRRQAALSLGSIDPKNPRAGARRAKIFDWGLYLQRDRLLLVATLAPDPTGKTEVHLRVAPADRLHLPPGLHLSVFDEDGTLFRQEASREADSAVQFGFRGDCGDRFAVELSLGDMKVREQFAL